jgi:hypothetical protein
MGIAMAGRMAGALGGAPAAPSATPPPLPGAAFFVALNGAQTGPHAADTLRHQVAAGTLTADTLVWKQGLAAWTPARDVPELAPLFAGSPPPLPGA